jgi:hypothetical protein
MFHGTTGTMVPWMTAVLGALFDPAVHGSASDWVLDLVSEAGPGAEAAREKAAESFLRMYQGGGVGGKGGDKMGEEEGGGGAEVERRVTRRVTFGISAFTPPEEEDAGRPGQLRAQSSEPSSVSTTRAVHWPDQLPTCSSSSSSSARKPTPWKRMLPLDPSSDEASSSGGGGSGPCGEAQEEVAAPVHPDILLQAEAAIWATSAATAAATALNLSHQAKEREEEQTDFGCFGSGPQPAGGAGGSRIARLMATLLRFKTLLWREVMIMTRNPADVAGEWQVHGRRMSRMPALGHQPLTLPLPYLSLPLCQDARSRSAGWLSSWA